jgi:hypothetical protein
MVQYPIFSIVVRRRSCRSFGWPDETSNSLPRPSLITSNSLFKPACVFGCRLLASSTNRVTVFRCRLNKPRNLRWRRSLCLGIFASPSVVRSKERASIRVAIVIHTEQFRDQNHVVSCKLALDILQQRRLVAADHTLWQRVMRQLLPAGYPCKFAGRTRFRISRRCGNHVSGIILQHLGQHWISSSSTSCFGRSRSVMNC